ncbi:MAG: septum formation initiator family protein [Parcubacteria group bacterium]|nr:septum formation initiator family protein [Parcubacteria group bacterium]
MRDFKRRTLFRSILYSPITASVLVILIFFVGQATIKIFKTYLETRQDYQAAIAEFEKLQNREKSIKNRIESLSTERGIEEEIRNKFGFIKEGEEVVIIVEPPPSFEGTKNDSDSEVNASSAGNIFESILNIFRSR